MPKMSPLSFLPSAIFPTRPPFERGGRILHSEGTIDVGPSRTQETHPSSFGPTSLGDLICVQPNDFSFCCCRLESDFCACSFLFSSPPVGVTGIGSGSYAS